jgi:hypothetical protein
MDKYIKNVIQERLRLRTSGVIPSEIGAKATRRPVIDLVVDEYLLPDKAQGKATSVDDTFQQLAIDQMKTFLFAGHDTSSSTICYIYHLLNLNPALLAKVRQEHNEVFGKAVETAGLIKTNPHLLNELPFTTAVIKGKPSKSRKAIH